MRFQLSKYRKSNDKLIELIFEEILIVSFRFNCYDDVNRLRKRRLKICCKRQRRKGNYLTPDEFPSS